MPYIVEPRGSRPVRVSSAVVCCHDVIHGPPHELRDFFRGGGVEDVFFIGHPNKSVKENAIRNSYFQHFHRGTLARERKLRPTRLPELAGYVKDFLLTLAWPVFAFRRRPDIFVGVGNLNAFAGVILRRLGWVKFTVYYVIDYFPDRFANRWVNMIYQRVEKWAALASDATWNYSSVMIDKRAAYWGRDFRRQHVTPHGIHAEAVASRERRPYDMVYFGFIHVHQGVELALEAWPRVVEEFPDARLHLVGRCDAEYAATLEARINALGIADKVHFHGYVESHEAVHALLGSCRLALATYAPDHPFIKNTDPGKIKSYLLAGLPVVMTDVGQISRDVAANRIGWIIEYDAEALARTVCAAFAQRGDIAEQSQRAMEFARQFDWRTIFARALEDSYSAVMRGRS